MKLTKHLRVMVLAGALPFGMAAQTAGRPDVAPTQNPGVQQSQGRHMDSTSQTSQNAPETNPGFDRQIPNQAMSGQTPQTNSSLQATRNGNLGFDFGWLGLLGVAGLFGITGASHNRVKNDLNR